jgi:hypothetical protein
MIPIDPDADARRDIARYLDRLAHGSPRERDGARHRAERTLRLRDSPVRVACGGWAWSLDSLGELQRERPNYHIGRRA